MCETDQISIPSPTTIRSRLSENLQERRVLRKLLRVAQEAAEAQSRGAIAVNFIRPQSTTAVAR